MNEITDKCQSKLRIINVSFSFQHMAEYNSYATTFCGDVRPKLYLESLIAE